MPPKTKPADPRLRVGRAVRKKFTGSGWFDGSVTSIADGSFERRIEVSTALMAALGMGGGRRVRPWVPLTGGTSETRAFEAVKLAVELGVDVNAADTDGRTALDAAEALQYESVVRHLVAHGATPGL